jgi:hypothetical protein
MIQLHPNWLFSAQQQQQIRIPSLEFQMAAANVRSVADAASKTFFL